MTALAHYIQHGSKIDAYCHAYKSDNMSRETATRRAQEVFARPHIAAHIAGVKHQASVQTAIDAEWVLKRAAMLADFNIASFIRVQDDGTAAYDFSTATDDDWYCISEYTADRIFKGMGDDLIPIERVKIKTACKLKALELVGKHIGVQAFKENIGMTAEVTFNMNFSGED